MTDLWCALGVMAANPALFNLPVGFTVCSVDVVFREPGSPPTLLSSNTKGLLMAGPTQQVQEQVQDVLDQNFSDAAPVVSLYAAGRLCRLKVTAGSVADAALADFKAAFDQTFGATPLTSRIAVALGASMLDPGLSTEFADSSRTAKRQKQFHIAGDPDFAKLQAMLAHSKFQTAQSALTNAETWRETCPERHVFYSRFALAAN